MQTIPVFKPAIGAAEIKAATEALELGWLGMGSYVKDLEVELARYLELGPERGLVAVNTGTSALHLALLAAGVGNGDEVITPALNNIGDFQAIGMCGARPAFVDIGEEDLGIDPALIEQAITPRVKAIIVLHYMGLPCKVDAVLAIAREHGLRVIEDAAHATGTRVNGERIGSYGDMACFSFDAIKTLTCIDGGVVIVPTKAEAEQFYPARLLGMTQPNERLYSNARASKFDVGSQGFRYHLANLHAAIGLSQLRQLETFITNRRAYCRRYNELLSGLDGLILPASDFANASVFHYVVRVTGGRRSEFSSFLTARGIDTGIHWLPGHWFTWLKDCRGADVLPVTDRVGSEIVTLPLWSFMEDAVIDRVASEVRAFFAHGRVVSRPQVLTGRGLLKAVKEGLGGEYTLPVAGFPQARLRAIVTANPRSEDVDKLTTWRNRNSGAFLTEFVASESRTRQWLTQSVSRDDSRILFMIEETEGPSLGYVGIAFVDWETGYAEADSVVRGDSRQPGIMGAAMETLLEWGRSELKLRRFGVRVLSDNPALGFYVKHGFKETSRVALERVHRPDCVAWQESQSGGERQLIYMEQEAQ